MEAYRTEEEQIEALKRWWRENGKMTVVGIALALALVFGWRGWQDHRQSQAGDASAMFDQLLQADSLVQRSGEVTVTAQTLAETLKSAYGGMSYGQMAALYKAKYAVMKGDYGLAADELNWVLDQQPTDAIRAQTEMRLAQVYAAQSEYDRALQILAGLFATGYAPQAQELKGDILIEQGDTDGALAAYQEALAAAQAQESPSRNPMLEMKINDLRQAADTRGGEA